VRRAGRWDLVDEEKRENPPDEKIGFCCVAQLNFKVASPLGISVLSLGLRRGAPKLMQLDDHSYFVARPMKEIASHWPEAILYFVGGRSSAP
jgi:hypothetical protein